MKTSAIAMTIFAIIILSVAASILTSYLSFLYFTERNMEREQSFDNIQANNETSDSPLSATETEVMRMKGQGMTTTEIAKARGVSQAAIKKAVTRANRKLALNGEKNRVDT